MRGQPDRNELLNPGRRGRATQGLYPEISRHKLAAEVGCSVQYLSRVLLGAHGVKGFGLMLRIADALHLPPERLRKDLQDARDEYIRENGDGRPKGKRARRRQRHA